MEKLSEIVSYLDRVLNTEDFEDDSQNGLQVESDNKRISRVGLAVDSGLSVIEEAVKSKVQLLIVHHGIFWNTPVNLNGILGKKISLLMKNGCSLYTSHLPLDGHLSLGNAAVIARRLKLKNIQPFCKYGKNFIGVKAQCSAGFPLRHFEEQAKLFPAAGNVVVLPFGKKDIRNIGIVTGSGSFALSACASDELDLLISGEPKQSAYHTAKELKMNAIFAGHYATETFGVRAVGEHLQKRFNLKTIFIDQPTGI